MANSDVDYLSEKSGFERMLLKELSAGYYSLHDILENRSAESKIVHFMLSAMESNGDSRTLAATQHEIAELTGLSRETVNKQLQALDSRGLIGKERGRLIIRDLDALERFTD